MLQILRPRKKSSATVNRGLLAMMFLLTSSGVSMADITGVKSASNTRAIPAAQTHKTEIRTSSDVAETTGNLRCWQSGELIIDEAGIAFLPIKDGSTMVTFGLKGTVTSRLFMEGDTTCFYKTK